MSSNFPLFVNNPSCKDYDPEWWFPEEKGGHRRWSRTPNAIKAREICLSCPARKECKEYAMTYKSLYGIWAGQDWYERQAEQDALGVEGESFSLSYITFIDHTKGKYIRSHTQKKEDDV